MSGGRLRERTKAVNSLCLAPVRFPLASREVTRSVSLQWEHPSSRVGTFGLPIRPAIPPRIDNREHSSIRRKPVLRGRQATPACCHIRHAATTTANNEDVKIRPVLRFRLFASDSSFNRLENRDKRGPSAVSFFPISETRTSQTSLCPYAQSRRDKWLLYREMGSSVGRCALLEGEDRGRCLVRVRVYLYLMYAHEDSPGQHACPI